MGINKIKHTWNMSSISKYENDIQKYLSGDLTLEKYIDEINSSIFVDLNIGNDFVWSAVTIFVDNKVHTSNIFARQNDIKSIVTKRSDALNDLIARKKCKSFTNALVSDATINSKYIRLDGQLLKSCVQINENNESINNDDVVFSDSENTAKDCQNSIDRLRKCFSILPNFDVTEFRPFFATYRKFSTDLLGENNDVSFLYFIPSSLYVSRLKILFYICVSSKFVEEKDNIDGLYRSISFLFDKHASAIYVKQLQIEELKRKRESLKSAVSAIMTRNMSHNLGSHYLHYTKTQLEQLAKKGGEFGPDIRGAAKVMGYMQGRMDYLATLISMDRYPYGCVNFKSQIFDELTIDDFSKRHFPHKRIEPAKLKEKIDILCQRMKALQSIQSKLSDKKGMVNEEYIEFRKNIDTNLMDLHTISGDALKDENHNRTTNFLLSNLILSENFTRPSILDDNLKVANNLNKINLQVLLFENDKSEIFTGTLDKKDSEEDIKRKLSEINIAMPGGVMSCHAFFNIVENFIRNSAKYLQSDFDKDGNLTITIKITEINGYYEFTIFDNKQNANKKQFDTTKSLLDNLLDKVSNLRILDDNDALDKKDKGFKEMLFSALWLRSYMYQNVTDDDSPHSYEEVLVRIQSEEDKEKRKETIKEYGFSLLAVNNWGIEDSSEHANLALRFILPKFEEIVDVKLMDNNLSVNLCTMLNCHGDVVYVDNDKFNSFVDQMNETRKENKDTYEKDMIIPRMVTAAPNSISALRAVLHKRFGDEFEKYHIIFSDESLERASDASVNERIKYARHLSTQDKMEIYTNYAYADSISGGNFTITLADVLTRWENDDFSEESDAYYQILKIKESALTRITIIDERFFKKMKEQQLETELACKNIRILNYNDSMSEQTDVADFLEGNAFNNNENQTHFLSIHLGIIEKITKNVDMFKKIENNNEKVRLFMKMLKEHFGPKVFISVHSGRGNFSAELEDALDMYPFISMAALENAYENSKYLLSQLFYSTIYIGKGVANQHNKQDS